MGCSAGGSLDTTADVIFDDTTLPDGWTRKCVQRATGVSAGKWDVYVYNPMGKKFRSQKEVCRYLEEIRSDLNPCLFSFNAYKVGESVHGRKQPAKKSSLSSSISKMKLKPQTDTPGRKIRSKFSFAKRRLKRPGGRLAGETMRARPSWDLPGSM